MSDKITCQYLTPIKVNVLDEETNQNYASLVLYNHITDEVHFVKEHDRNPPRQEFVDAVRSFVGRSTERLDLEVVDEQTWKDIAMLSGFRIQPINVETQES